MEVYMDQKKLVKETKSKNKLSNVLITLRIIADLIPQLLIILMVGQGFQQTLTMERIQISLLWIVLAYVVKAVCGYLAIWKAHEAAYDALTEIRQRIIQHLKKLPTGFFKERKIGDLTNIIHHDVDQVEIFWPTVYQKLWQLPYCHALYSF